jgi:hypothetical protein
MMSEAKSPWKLRGKFLNLEPSPNAHGPGLQLRPYSMDSPVVKLLD